MKLNTTLRSDAAQHEDAEYPIVELRQYTLRPGMRDELVELFEQEFIESQEAVGIKVIGQFRDLDDPDRFVWLRGFHDMPSRAQALGAFYGGPIWKTHREAANATMIDSDNVLLLHTAHRTPGFLLQNSERLSREARELPGGFVVATIYYLNGNRDNFVNFFERTLEPLFTEAGALILACFVTENSANNFPTLPVREGAHVFVWFALYRDQAAHELYTETLSGSRAWRSRLSTALARRIKGKPEVLRLLPTRRSLLHG